MPKLPAAAWPVLRVVRWSRLARVIAHCSGPHVTVVPYRATTSALARPTVMQYYLVDQRSDVVECVVETPLAEGDRLQLTVRIIWWLADPVLLLAVAPADAVKILGLHVARTVRSLYRDRSDDALSFRRRVDEALCSKVIDADAGLRWVHFSARVRTTHPVPRLWRRAIDTWLHADVASALDEPCSRR